MAGPITESSWRAVRGSLARTAERFARLVETAEHPEAAAIGRWTVAETAAHVATVAELYAAVLPGVSPPRPIPGAAARVEATALDELGDLNALALDQLTERAPAALAERVAEDVGRLLDAGRTAEPDQLVSWLGGARLPLAGCYAHLLNELHLHGRDIASAIGARWPIPHNDAAMAFELFLVQLLSHDTGRLLVHEPFSDRPVSVRFRSRYTAPVVLEARRDRIAVLPGDHPADAQLHFQPAALMQVLFGRLSVVRAACTGKTLVWGRKPWSLARFLGAVRFP
ncbi:MULTISPECIES: maleylpyruvate isomerase N-terminal domain-containing protein [Actinomycetes]|uniref:maleylpyruvate isomerase N-terminal domain-containing protein n=1 Tax=Actinomycetes TaxID=1760 RepID=UPI0001B54562|nr:MULTISPECIES: maleylpyruvate isomerase N-terminal domain-containing protein [Actinomycetes]